MRKHLSVFMLLSRSTIYKIIALLLLMAVVELGLFWFVFSRGVTEEGFALELLVEQSCIFWVFAAGFLLLTLLLGSTTYEASARQGYTLLRLSISPRWVFFWQCVYNLLCYLLFWAVQLLLVMAMSRIYMAKAAPEFLSGQTVFLAFYRNSFLHGLLPLDDVMFWVRNGAMFLALSLCAAHYPQAQRMRRWLMPMILTLIMAASFPCEIGNITNCVAVISVGFFAVYYALMHQSGEEPNHED